MGLRVTQGIEKGIRATDRRPGLRDGARPGEYGSDRFAPTFDVIINGSGITEDVRAHIVSIEYEDNEELFDEIKITLQGYFKDPIKQRDVPIPEWAQSDPTFNEGNVIWILMGYGPYVRLIGGGEIVKREFTYGQQPQVVITAYEPLHRMAQVMAEDAVVYKGMRSSDIVKKVGIKKEYSGAIGSLFNVSEIPRLPIFTPRSEVQKRGESDYAFLKRMADIRGWHLFTRFDSAKKKFNLYYGPDVDKQDTIFRYDFNPSGNLLPEDTLLEFVPEINTIDQHTDVEITAIDEARKKTNQQSRKYVPYADGKKPIDRTLAGGNTEFKQQELKNPFSYRFKLFGFSKKIIATRPFKNESEVKKFIIAWARENIKSFIMGNGKIAGNEFLQSRQNIYFMGLGETFSGSESKPAKWYLTKVRHKMSIGSDIVYETSFDCRKVIDWLPEGDLTANPPAQAREKETKSKFNRVQIIQKDTEIAKGNNS